MSQAFSIRGAGGGKSGGIAGALGLEDQDTLCSEAYAQVLDLVSEGEIEGLVGGAMGVYFDDTPVQNPDGSYNFIGGFSLSTTNGQPGQAAIPGFTDVESETPVGLEVFASTPILQTVTGDNVDRIRVRVAVPQLVYQNKETGEISGSSVSLSIAIDSNDGGGFKQVPLVHTTTLGGVTRNSDTQITANAAVNGFSLAAQYTAAQVSSTDSDGNKVTYYDSCHFQVQIQNTDSPGSPWVTVSSQDVVPNPNNYDYEKDAYGNLVQDSDGSFVMTPTPVQNFAINISGLTGQKWAVQLVKGEGGGTLKFVDTVGSGTGDATTTAQIEDTISGKTMVQYERSYTIPVSGPGPFSVKVSRTSPNATDRYTSNSLVWQSVTAITDAKLAYPHSALIGVAMDSQHFSAVPTRGYHIRGLKIQVPTNYDPILRQYSGTWNGTFQTAWSNNPAWVLYDLLTNPRYGLGDRISAAQIDKWALYAIGQYCDELIPDGFGGYEPRFAINLCLQTQNDAYKVINDLCSVFRGIAYWSAGAVMAVQDSPKDVTAQFTNANVLNGQFEYASSGLKARHTVALVTWNNPKNQYRQEVEYVPDNDGIAKYGIRETQVVAFGCSSRGQAHRLGRWLLYSERMESETVTFKVMHEGLTASLGQIFAVADSYRAGEQIGGRVKSGASLTRLPLDRQVTLKAGVSYTVSVLVNGTLTDTNVVVAGTDTTTDTLTLGTPLATAPAGGAVWTLTQPQLETQLFRCMSVSEDSGIYTITGTEYNPAKFAAIEQGVALQPRPITDLNPSVSAPTGLGVTEYQRSTTTGTINFVTMYCNAQSNAVAYRFSYRLNGDNWTTLPDAQTPSANVDNVTTGQFDMSVSAISATGAISPPAYFSTTLAGKTTKPNPLISLTATGDLFAIDWAITYPNDPDIAFAEIWVSSTDDESTATLLTALPYPLATYTQVGLGIGVGFYGWGRVRDTSGNYSDWFPTDLKGGVYAASLSDPTDVLDILNGKITSLQLSSDLATAIQINTAPASEVINQINETESEVEDVAASVIEGILDMADRWEDTRVINKSIADLTTTVNNNQTAANESIATLTTDSQAKAQAVTTLQGSVNANTATIQSILDLEVDATSALMTRFTGLDTSIAGNTSKIQDVENLNLDATTALMTRFTNLDASVASNTASIQDIESLNLSASSALMTQISSMNASIGANSSSISNITNLNLSSSSALMTELNQMNANISGNQTSINNILNLNLTSTTALMQQINSMNSSIGSNSTSITNETTARINGDSANASSINTLNTTVGKNSSSIQTLQTTVNGVTAEYMLKTDVNGYISGFGLYNNGATSAFIVNADYFAVGKSGQTTKYPFVIGTVNGVTAVAMSNAFIQDASVNTLQIGGNAVTVPVYAGDSSVITGSNSFVTIASCSITIPSGLSATIVAQAAVAQGYPSGTGSTGTARLWIGGTLVFEATGAAAANTLALAGGLSVGSGTFQVLLQWQGSDANIQQGWKGLTAMAAKR